MAKDGYIPSDGNAGDLAVGEKSVAVPGGGVVIDSSEIDFVQGTQATAAADGNPHVFPSTPFIPTPWIDANGNILQPGLYLVRYRVNVAVPFTARGLIQLARGVTDQWELDTDVFGDPAIGPVTRAIVIALTQINLPIHFYAQLTSAAADVTGVLGLNTIIERLAH